MMNKIFSIICALALCAMPIPEGQDANIELSRSAARAPRTLREDARPDDLFYVDTGESEEEWEQGWRQVLALYEEEEPETPTFDFGEDDWGDFDWNIEAI